MNTIYKYQLSLSGVATDVHPIYKDDIALDYEHESSQLFYRGKLTQKMTFVGSEAQTIINADFEQEFILLILSSDDGGVTWEDFYQCVFYKTDCTIDEDNLSVSVKPDVYDRYMDVLDSLEKEYNLIDLLPQVEPVRMTKRGIIQIYGGGDGVLTNFYGGMSWEQDYDIGDDDPTDYNFAEITSTLEISFEDAITGLSDVFKGLRDEFLDGVKFYNGEGVYYIQCTLVQAYTYVAEIKQVSDDTAIYQASFSADSDDFPATLEFVNYDTPSDIIYGSVIETGIYSRILCDVEQITIEGITYDCEKLSTADPSAANINYHYTFAYPLATITTSDRSSTDATKWGRKDDGTYYLPPTDSDIYYPVARSLWVNYSQWFSFTATDYAYLTAARKEYYLNDAYPLWSVISVLLAKATDDVTFEGTSTYSEFFYAATNPVSELVNEVPYITPKSNILVGEYSEPAKKAPVSLGMLFEMLKKAFGCYWYIDDDNCLRIEHISWFKNGGSYTVDAQVGIDLTNLGQPTNEKAWTFSTNKYQYDKLQMAARYQYKWMDEGSEIFDWHPYEVTSRFVTTDKVEEINISNFSSDVDYMLVAPENCSKDGFALLMTLTDTEVYVPIITSSIGGKTYITQNFYASLYFLQLKYLDYDMPTWDYEMNDTSYTSKGIQRNKKQQITFPLGGTMPYLMRLVRTDIGDGQIEKISISLSSWVAKTTLKYDTYDNE